VPGYLPTGNQQLHLHQYQQAAEEKRIEIIVLTDD